MATVNVAPASLSAGTPVLDQARVVVLHKPWPFRPMLPVSEALEWRTEIMGSRTGEQRVALRSATRQTFSTTVRLSESRYAVAKGLARARAGTMIGCPVWSEAIDLTSNLASTDDTVAIDTTHGDWRIDGGVMLWETPEKYAVGRIIAISPTSIGLMRPIGVDLVKPAVIPLRWGFTPEGFSVDRQTTFSDVQAKFQVVDNIDLAALYVSDYPQYQSLDVVTERPVLVTNVSESIVRAAEYVDNGFGPVAIEPLRAYVDFGQTVSFEERRNAALWRRRLWLHSLRGKQKAFWLPSFNRDLDLRATMGSAATTITVASIGPVADYVNRHFMIMTNDGTRYMRQITGAVSLGGGLDQLTISSALGVTIDPADVKEVSFLAMMRLNSDTVTIEHRYALDSVVSIPVIEVPA